MKPDRARDAVTGETATPAPEIDDDAAGSRSNPLFAAAALAFSGVHFATFFDPKLPIYTDIRYFVYFAWRMAEGAVPHLDLFDNKTFGSNFVAALFYQAGHTLGLDELSTIRACCLSVCALGGLLSFVVFRRLGGGSPVAGFLGLLAYLAFGFIGTLAAIGNFPKLFMPYLAMAAALLVLQRRWFWAGTMGALAFMDWQVGALVGVAALLSALLETHARRRAALLVIAGGVVGLIPLVVYYAWNGALDVAFEQTILASISRGEESLATHTAWSRMSKMWRLAGNYCPEQRFLFVNALAGLAVVPIWWWRRRSAAAGRLVFTLATYHYGMLAFSLLDFQRFGDFFLVLQSMAFFLGMVWLAVYQALEGWWGSRDGLAARRPVVAAIAIALAFLAARPAWLRPPIVIRVGPIAAQTTLDHQLEVAHEIRRRTVSKKLVLLGSSELLFLMRHTNPLPLVYFNRPALSVYGRPGESEKEAMARVALSVDPDAVILPGRRKFKPGEVLLAEQSSELPGYRGEIITAGGGAYGAILYSRVADPERMR